MVGIISREESGLVPPRYRHLISTPTPRLWLHHTAGALDAGGNGVWWDDVRGIQDFHMRPVSQGGKGWSDIAYSFLVGGGQVFEGRGAGVAGGHTAGDNTTSHAICLIGDYTWMVPKQEDLEAIAWLMAYGRDQGWWGDLTGPHRDAPGAQTACCGQNLIACIPDLWHMATPLDPTPDLEDDEMFSYEYELPGKSPKVMILVSSGKQVRLNGALVGAQRRRSESHLGEIDTPTYQRFREAFGTPIGV